MHHYINALKKYATFSGRAQRAEYWYFALFSTLIAIVLSILGGFIPIGEQGSAGFWLIVIYYLFIIIPSISVTVRRLHDTNRSGWMYFIGFIPIIGGVWLFVLTVLDSTPEDNKYGPNPKGVTAPMAPQEASPQTPQQ